MTLYEQHISKNGRITYRPHTGWTPPADAEITDEELVTLTASLAVTVLMVQQQMLPDNSAVRRQVRNVEYAILKLFQGHGRKADPEMVDYWYRCWDATMQRIAGGAA